MDDILSLIPSADGPSAYDAEVIDEIATVNSMRAVAESMGCDKKTKSSAVLARELLAAKRKAKKAEATADEHLAKEANDRIAYIEELQQDLSAQPEMVNAVQLIKHNLEKHASPQLQSEMSTSTEVASNAAADILQHINGQTNRYDVNKLLANLNVNRDMQLSRRDTADLLASILTCNETQLQALITNPKIPVSIKTFIKRIQLDANLGNTETVEKLWDRIFGKQGLQDQTSISERTLQATQPDGTCTIIPQTPISREAYVILRETILK